MADQPHPNQPPPKLEKAPLAEGKCPAVSPTPTTPDPVDELSAAQEKGKKLTVEEQMALYEKDLKENDWGHQPC